jgi:hypothetical protein
VKILGTSPGVYHIVVCIGPAVYVDPDRLMAQSGLAFYRVRQDAADLAREIDMALLDHIHCWSTIFAGGDLHEGKCLRMGLHGSQIRQP